MARLRAAQQDLAQFERDPTTFLADAPELRGWSFLRSGRSLCLTGRVRGHPVLDDDRKILTSEIVAIGAELDWARTLNTFYRLVDHVPGDQTDAP